MHLTHDQQTRCKFAGLFFRKWENQQLAVWVV